MRSKKTRCIRFVALLLFIGAPIAAESQTITGATYNKNDSFFEAQFKTDVGMIRAASTGIQCGLLPPAARPVALAAATEQILNDAKISYGSSDGNISVWGASEVYQAVDDLYKLNSTLVLEAPTAKKPDQDTCSSLVSGGVIAALNKLIESGY